MNIVLKGTAGPYGWPLPDCHCASCGRLRAAGTCLAPTRIVIDGVPLEDCSRWEVPGGYDVRAPSGGRLLIADGPGARPEPTPEVRYDAVLLDLIGAPDQLGLLRRTGVVTDSTEVHAVHVDHRVASPAELERRLNWWLRPAEGPYRTLLLGGSRSGKSAEAELRLLARPNVTYIATGGTRDDDPAWKARIATHQERRPAWWPTIETTDLPQALGTATGAVLIDGIGTWLTAAMDDTNAWDDPTLVQPRIDELIRAWRNSKACVVAVTDEVGLSVIPHTSAGRVFRDTLGTLNQRLAAESEEAALVVAGRVMDLP